MRVGLGLTRLGSDERNTWVLQRGLRTWLAWVAVVVAAAGVTTGVVAALESGSQQPPAGAVLTSGSDFGLAGSVQDLIPGDSTPGNLTVTVTDPYTVPIDLTSITVTVSPTQAIPSVPANCPGTLLWLNGTRFSGATPSATVNYSETDAPVASPGQPATISLNLLLDRSAGNDCADVTFPFNYSGVAIYGFTSPCSKATKTGSFTVASGQSLCIEGRVNGGLIIQSGAAVYLHGATISGGLTSTGAVAIEVCDSTVAGGVNISGSTGFVMVGDDGDDSAQGQPCTANTIKGGTTLNANGGGFELGGNSISGPVSITNNAGSGLGEDAAPEVEGNTISSSLSCSGNASISYGGHANTASSKTGQCSGF